MQTSKTASDTAKPRRAPSRRRRLAIHLAPNIPAGGIALAGCAPFARRGETKDLRAALNLTTAPTRVNAG